MYLFKAIYMDRVVEERKMFCPSDQSAICMAYDVYLNLVTIADLVDSVCILRPDGSVVCTLCYF